MVEVQPQPLRIHQGTWYLDELLIKNNTSIATSNFFV